MFGLAGNDTLTGGGGNDKLYGGLGDDKLYGGLGQDQFFGDLGDDQLFGGNDNDKLYGQLGNDYADGGNNDDVLDGSLGDDVLFGNNGNDNITAGQGNDTVIGGDNQDTILGFGGGSGSEIDNLIGGGKITALDDQGNANIDPSPDGAKDVFVLGNARSVYYAQAGYDDYAIIFDFENGVDQIQLSPSATYIYQTGAFFSNLDTLIFANLPTGPDLIAIVEGVALTSN
ncbi:MAG: hypothetical protein DSM106950_36630 [Stigonema ocellatum SAG 48.90 = DSM 106950]|nr:hypothetical protein [Stigonema ocellatum SAG 48.90 = DSM 106950]